jgi:hypothetical protein
VNVNYVRGDVAETEMYAIAFLVEPTDMVAMRSLRYIDRFRRDENGWRISDRVHTLDWACQMPANYAVTLAQRVSALPDRS